MKFLRFTMFLFLAGMFFASCQKELSLETGSATGTLKADTSGDCLPVIINGTYAQDTLLNSTNYVEISVDIAQTGAYDIRTDTINGYFFSASGSAAVTGIQTIRLQGSGRPVSGGLDIFSVQFSGTACEINIVVSGSGGGPVPPPATNDSIVATINGVYKTFKVRDSAVYDNSSLPGYNALVIFGESNAAGDEVITLAIARQGTATPAAGSTYTTNQFPAAFVLGAYSNATNDYVAVSDPATMQTPPFTITVTSISATKITGTFSGPLPDDSGAGPDAIVTNGIFSVTIYP